MLHISLHTHTHISQVSMYIYVCVCVTYIYIHTYVHMNLVHMLPATVCSISKQFLLAQKPSTKRRWNGISRSGVSGLSQWNEPARMQNTHDPETLLHLKLFIRSTTPIRTTSSLQKLPESLARTLVKPKSRTSGQFRTQGRSCQAQESLNTAQGMTGH